MEPIQHSPPRQHRLRAVLAAAAAVAAVAAIVAVTRATSGTASGSRTVTYVVWGSAARVTYGPAGSNLAGEVPMKVTRQLADPAYYAVFAQLSGGGTVHCQIGVDGKVVSQATASGGANVAQCEISPDGSGGWQSGN
jgi:hypothetical protein